MLVTRVDQNIKFNVAVGYAYSEKDRKVTHLFILNFSRRIFFKF